MGVGVLLSGSEGAVNQHNERGADSQPDSRSLSLSADANCAREQITSWIWSLRAYLRVGKTQQITVTYRTISRRLRVRGIALLLVKGERAVNPYTHAATRHPVRSDVQAQPLGTPAPPQAHQWVWW